MWQALIISIFGISLITILQTPKAWWRSKSALIFLIIFHIIGITSLLILLFGFYLIEDETLRTVIVGIETCYFTFMLFTAVLTIFRTCMFYLARHFDMPRTTKFINDRENFICISMIVTILYLMPGIIFATNLVKTSYDVTINKPGGEPMKVALVADLHTGAGAFDEQLDQMADIVNEMKADVLLIAGDVTDSSTSVKDLELLEATFGKIETKYGIYYVEGNHERESRFDPLPYLERAGVKYIHETAVTLPNQVNIVGIGDDQEMSATEILDKAGLDKSLPCIAIQHRPKELEELASQCDLAAIGHTHGYQYPFMNIISPFRRDLTYGSKQFGDMTAIVTSGVSEWGYRAKWPSQSEVVEINVNFKKAE